MGMQWVVVADSSRARIFQTDASLERLVEVQDLLNPEGRLDDADMRNDAKGRFYGKGERFQGHTAEPNLTKEAHDAALFSREIGQFLAQGRDAQQYDSLVVVAPPEFLGQLRQELPERVGRCIKQQMNRDISNWNNDQISAYLKQQLH